MADQVLRFARSERATVRPIDVVAVIWIVAVVVFLIVNGGRALRVYAPDFEYFYKAGAWLYTWGELDPGYDRLADGSLERRGSIEWYLPFASRVMTLFAWLPMRVAGWIWLLLNVTALLATMRLVGRYICRLRDRDWPVVQAGALLATIVFWTWEFRLNQIDNFALLLMIASFVHWQAGKRTVAGFWLGLATLLKITPGLLVVWFVLKREFRTAGIALATAVLAGPVSDAVVFGPQQAGAYYAEWAHAAVHETSHRGLVMNQIEMDWRNQGMGATLSRLLHGTSYATRFDNDPRIRMPDEPAFINVAEFSRPTVLAIAMGIIGISGLALLWLARHPARRQKPWELRVEWVLFVLAILWFMPVMRRYHLIFCFPAAGLLLSCVLQLGIGRAWSRLALVALGALVTAQLALLSRMLFDTHVVEAAGVFLIAVAIVAVPLIVLRLELRRGRISLPETLTTPAERPSNEPATAAAASHD